MTNRAIDAVILTDLTGEEESGIQGGVGSSIDVFAFATGTQDATAFTKTRNFGFTLRDGRKVSVSFGGGISIGIDAAIE